MAGYTKVNLKEDVDDQAPNFGLSPDLEARMARVPLEMEGLGVSYQRLDPNFRIPFAHRHSSRRRCTSSISGGLRAKIEDEILEMKPWDALRVQKDTMRGFEAGAEGAEMIAIGAPNTGPGDGDGQDRKLLVGLELFPDSTSVDRGELAIGGLAASALARDFGTPLVVYCEGRSAPGPAPTARPRPMRSSSTGRRLSRTWRSCVSWWRRGSAPTSRRSGSSGSPRLPAYRRSGSSSTETTSRTRSCALRLRQRRDSSSWTRSRSSSGRASQGSSACSRASRRESTRTRTRRSAPATSARSSGCRPGKRLGIRDALVGLHVHIGSQLLSTAGAEQTLDWLNGFLAESGWTPEVVDLGGGLGVPTHPSETAPSIAELVGLLVAGLEVDARLDPRARPLACRTGGRHALPRRLGQARRGEDVGRGRRRAVGQPSTAALRCALHGGPGPARGRRGGSTVGVAGLHCESGDVLIDAVELPEPRRDDLLAVPATGAYTLSMGSNYNVTPRPAALLVGDGRAG